jgi:hypothetical protein
VDRPVEEPTTLPTHLQPGYQNLSPKEMARVEAGGAWPGHNDDRLFDYEALVNAFAERSES